MLELLLLFIGALKTLFPPLPHASDIAGDKMIASPLQISLFHN